MKGHRDDLERMAHRLAPAGVVMFFFLVLPLLDFLAFETGVATVIRMAQDSASLLVTSDNFDNGLNLGAEAVQRSANSLFGWFAHLQPVGGLHNSGVDYYIYETDNRSHNVTIYGPNSPVIGRIDPDNKSYVCRSDVHYDVGPFCSLSALPFLADVGAVGKAASVHQTGWANFEDPLGVDKLARLPGASTGSAASNPAGTAAAGTAEPPVSSAVAGGWLLPPTQPPEAGDLWYGRGPWSWQNR